MIALPGQKPKSLAEIGQDILTRFCESIMDLPVPSDEKQVVHHRSSGYLTGSNQVFRLVCEASDTQIAISFRPGNAAKDTQMFWRIRTRPQKDEPPRVVIYNCRSQERDPKSQMIADARSSIRTELTEQIEQAAILAAEAKARAEAA